jgi:uncharacterized protein YcgL (UPF0745 family)
MVAEAKQESFSETAYFLRKYLGQPALIMLVDGMLGKHARKEILEINAPLVGNML